MQCIADELKLVFLSNVLNPSGFQNMKTVSNDCRRGGKTKIKYSYYSKLTCQIANGALSLYFSVKPKYAASTKEKLIKIKGQACNIAYQVT